MAAKGLDKRLGQHHLTDPQLCRPLIDFLQPSGRRVLEIGPGGGYWAPAGTPHTFANAPDTPVEYASVMTPGGFEHFLDESARYFEGLDEGTPPDPDRIAEIAARHRSTPVGPPLAAVLAAGR